MNNIIEKVREEEEEDMDDGKPTVAIMVENQEGNSSRPSSPSSSESSPTSEASESKIDSSNEISEEKWAVH